MISDGGFCFATSLVQAFFASYLLVNLPATKDTANHCLVDQRVSLVAFGGTIR